MSAAHAVLAAMNKSLAQSNKSPDHWRKYDEDSPRSTAFYWVSYVGCPKNAIRTLVDMGRRLVLVPLNRSGAVAGLREQISGAE
jgi:hypothetical protein